MPIKPALRYLLVRHGVRVLSPGAYQRLGSYYELDHRSYDATLYVRDLLGPPAPHTRLIARARYVDRWGPWTVSVWAGPGGRRGHELRRSRGLAHEARHLEVRVHA
jgi:hypothetical protein